MTLDDLQIAASKPIETRKQTPKLEFETREFNTPKKQTDRDSDRTSRMSGVNDALAYVLVGVVLFAPVPLGSNRPVLWALWSAILAILCFTYLAILIRRAPHRTLQSASYRGIFALGGLCLLWVGVQLLPLDLAVNLQQNISVSTLSLTPEASLLGALRMMAYGMLFFMVLEVTTQRKRQRQMAWLLFFGMVVHAVWALLALNLLGDNFLWGEKTAYLGAATGTFINRNSFATFMGMGLVLGVAITTDHAHRPTIRHPNGQRSIRPEIMEIFALGLCLLMILFALLSTQSRMGTAASGLAAAMTYVLVAAQAIGWKKALVRAAVLAIPVAVIALIVFGQDVVERSLFTFAREDARLALWKQTLALIADRPLTGFGLDSYEAAFELYHQPGLSSAVTWEYAHSTYLALWVELGVVAGSLPMLALLWAGYRLLGNYREHGTPSNAAALGVLLLGALHSLVDFSLEIEANVFLFLMILALGLATPRKNKRAENSS